MIFNHTFFFLNLCNDESTFTTLELKKLNYNVENIPTKMITLRHVHITCLMKPGKSNLAKLIDKFILLLIGDL